MKTQNSNLRLQNRTAQRTENQTHRVDFAKRNANRQLPKEEVLNLLEKSAPLLCRMAQIVGQWIWIEFPERQPREITSILSQIGFHWNKRRQLWQHPCGVESQVATGDYDPRKRYGCQSANA